MPKINVTQDHIDMGNPSQAQSCPVALAIKETCNLHVSVYGKDGWLWTYDPERNITPDDSMLSFPESVAEFVKAFDDKEPVEPFSFEFDLPEGVECNETRN